MAMKAIIDRFGDLLNPMENGGGIVCSTYSGPHIEYTLGVKGIQPDEKLKVYGLFLEKNGSAFLKKFSWIDWKEVAESIGQEALIYEAAPLSQAINRALAVEAAALRYGWEQLKERSITYTAEKLKKRWKINKRLERKLNESI